VASGDSVVSAATGAATEAATGALPV
jgi:hypothetical protein